MTKQESSKKFYENNKEQKKQYQKKHYENNKEEIAKQMKQYYENNKEQIKEYYEKNKEAFRLKANQKYICSCGGHYTYSSKAKHMKTKKHINYMSNL